MISALVSQSESIFGIYNLVLSVQLAQEKSVYFMPFYTIIKIFLYLPYYLLNNANCLSEYEVQRSNHSFLQVLQLVGKRAHMCLLKERTHTF